MTLRQLNPLTAEVTNQTEITTVLIYILFVLGIIALILFDRRQGYIYLIATRQIALRLYERGKNLVNKIRNKNLKDEKDNREEQPSTSKSLGVLDTQKTYPEADLDSIQETAHQTPSLSDDFREMNIEDETPQVNLKQLFEKEKKGKDNQKNKSKSKLRSRIQIKKSELEADAQQQQQNSCDISQDLERSVEV